MSRSPNKFRYGATLPKDVKIPHTPDLEESSGRYDRRDPRFTSPLHLGKMGNEFIEALDILTKINGCSRRALVERLIADAYVDWQCNPNKRVTPI